ncbi:MAG TPA: hypothetical protein VFJ24_11765 [Gaiellales bacterium]|nr:hypothetical protein [Gaiellales bacterium]
MSRRISALVGLVVVGIVLGASACSNATGPAPVRADQTCDYSTGTTCHR